MLDISNIQDFCVNVKEFGNFLRLAVRRRRGKLDRDEETGVKRRE